MFASLTIDISDWAWRTLGAGSNLAAGWAGLLCCSLRPVRRPLSLSRPTGASCTRLSTTAATGRVG